MHLRRLWEFDMLRIIKNCKEYQVYYNELNSWVNSLKKREMREKYVVKMKL